MGRDCPLLWARMKDMLLFVSHLRAEGGRSEGKHWKIGLSFVALVLIPQSHHGHVDRRAVFSGGSIRESG